MDKETFDKAQEVKIKIQKYIDDELSKPLNCLGTLLPGRKVELLFFKNSNEFAVSVNNGIRYSSICYERAIEEYIQEGGVFE